MTRFRKPDWRRIKVHFSYTVEEISRVLGISKGTVRRWIKSGQLPALTDQKPMLVLGADLTAFGKGRRSKRQKCQPHECYCVKCRTPRIPFDNMADYVPLTDTGGNLRGLCPVCQTLMYKRVSLKQLPAISGILGLSGVEAQSRLTDSTNPSPNVHLTKEPLNNGKASSGQ